MSAKRVFIPDGGEKQGRYVAGSWPAEDIGRSAWRAPHRTHPQQPRVEYEDIPRTIATGPAPLDGAHAVSDIQGDEPAETRPVEGAGPVLWLVGLVGLLLAALAAWHLAARFA